MHKLTVLYGHPTDVETFETYYKTKHLPLAATMKGVAKLELTKILGTTDGSKPEFYRMAEIYFSDMEQLQKTMSSPEGQATSADLENFATGGVQVMIGVLE
ncbi:EthD family reductase [Winogradskyella ursingii]|uniref:EthD family reductase n=1 Tax=Winogradskyella ursingii TaxID=2686079 RepID=UPI0015CD81D9|nr:EthD family reductase [Winogradskyella ursingii]